VQAFMKSDNVTLEPVDVSDLIQTARGMYETFSLFYFRLQKQEDAYLKLRDKLQKSALYTKRNT
jgi:hypothetical protein